MLLSILILLFLPACHRIIKNSTFIGYTDYEKHLFFYLFSVSIIMLWFVGGLPAEFPFVQYGKFFTAIYFLSYPINFYMARRENRHTMELFHYSLDEITKKKKVYDRNNFVFHVNKLSNLLFFWSMIWKKRSFFIYLFLIWVFVLFMLLTFLLICYLLKQ